MVSEVAACIIYHPSKVAAVFQEKCHGLKFVCAWC